MRITRFMESRDQRSSLSAFWALPAHILKSRDAIHELADVAAMTLAIASGGRSKAFGQVSASAVVTMATASSTGWESEAERSPAKSWIRCWRWLEVLLSMWNVVRWARSVTRMTRFNSSLGRQLSREALNLVGVMHFKLPWNVCPSSSRFAMA